MYTHSVAKWLVYVLESGAEGPGFKSQSRRCRVSLRQTVHTHRASVHQSAKLVAALLRVARVTAGRLGGKQWQPTVGFMIHVTCRLFIISPPEQWSLQ